MHYHYFIQSLLYFILSFDTFNFLFLLICIAYQIVVKLKLILSFFSFFITVF